MFALSVARAVCFGATLCLVPLDCIHAQAVLPAALPATAPTSISPSQLPSANPVASTPRALQQVSWDGDQLKVVAINASLNSILREIAKKADLSVTGSCADEQVFGTYGPGSLDTILPQLLDGQSVNMLLVDHMGKQQKELMLTARTGGITPPGVQAAQANPASPVTYPAQQVFQGTEQPSRAPAPAVGNAVANGVGLAGQDNQNGTAAGASPADGNQPVSPNGVKTPQQIFEQLQRLRQQIQNSTQ